MWQLNIRFLLFHFRYLSSTVIVTAEIIKLLTCIGFIAYQHCMYNFNNARKHIERK